MEKENLKDFSEKFGKECLLEFLCKCVSICQCLSLALSCTNTFCHSCSEASHLSTICSAAADMNGCITIWCAVKYKLFTRALECLCMLVCVCVSVFVRQTVQVFESSHRIDPWSVRDQQKYSPDPLSALYCMYLRKQVSHSVMHRYKPAVSFLFVLGVNGHLI